MIDEAEREGRRFAGLPVGTRLGHIHLQVADLQEAERFYCGVLGFDVVAAMPTALFVSAGGYHHHIGMNTWHSLGAGTAPEDSVKLNLFTIEFPDEQARSEVLARLDHQGIEYQQEGNDFAVDDPFSNRLVLQVAG